MTYILILRIDTVRDFLEQYFTSEVSRLTSIEIAPDFETSTTVEYKRVTVKGVTEAGDELFMKSIEAGMLFRWKGFLKNEEHGVA